MPPTSYGRVSDLPGFDPKRFRHTAREARHRFAWLEGVLVLATLARHWRFEVESSSRPVPLPLITLRQKDGLRATLASRSSPVNVEVTSKR